MKREPSTSAGPAVIEYENFQGLFDVLAAKGYQTVGPTARDGAVVYDVITSVSDLPAGISEEQTGGKYRLKQQTGKQVFGYTVSPQSWKRHLHPPRKPLIEVQKSTFAIDHKIDPPQRLAFLGVRACELNAIEIQDKVLIKGPYVDPTYVARRKNALIIAVNCGQAANTCFCVSMNAGPKAEAGYDLCLTEVVENHSHYFVVETGSAKGKEILKGVKTRDAEPTEVEAAKKIVDTTAKHMGKTLDTKGIKELLYSNTEHPRWDEVALRCLNCANCTMVCPTCFCITIEDQTNLTGSTAERKQRWDSCYSLDFSYIHGGSVRPSAKARYRQWLTHKLASWVDQFGSFGCVGCGRCITWCPVGIDITEEAAAIRRRDQHKGVNNGKS